MMKKFYFIWEFLIFTFCKVFDFLSAAVDEKNSCVKGHIQLNLTNIALLLQEVTQKYWKLTDYCIKCCFLPLSFSLFTVTCASFGFLNSRVFSVLGHSAPQNYIPLVIICTANSFTFGLKMVFSRLNPAKYHCLH